MANAAKSYDEQDRESYLAERYGYYRPDQRPEAANDNQKPKTANNVVTMEPRKRSGRAARRQSPGVRRVNPTDQSFLAANQNHPPFIEEEYLQQNYGFYARPGDRPDRQAPTGAPIKTIDGRVVGYAKAPLTKEQQKAIADEQRALAEAQAAEAKEMERRKIKVRKKREGRRVNPDGSKQSFWKTSFGFAAASVFVSALATLQIATSLLLIIALGIAGAVASVGPLAEIVDWILETFTGIDMMGLVFIFWILSIAIGLVMIIGVFMIFTLLGMKPASGNLAGIKIAAMLGAMIAASYPVVNLFTIPLVIVWAIIVKLYPA